jgi:hypothetical protein
LEQIGDARVVPELNEMYVDNAKNAATRLSVVEALERITALEAGLTTRSSRLLADARTDLHEIKAMQKVLARVLKRFGHEVHVDRTDQLVERLIEIFEEHPTVVMDPKKGGLSKEEIRRIGRELNERGGFELMKKAHNAFARDCSLPDAAWWLESMWDGIGRWQS